MVLEEVGAAAPPNMAGAGASSPGMASSLSESVVQLVLAELERGGSAPVLPTAPQRTSISVNSPPRSRLIPYVPNPEVPPRLTALRAGVFTFLETGRSESQHGAPLEYPRRFSRVN